MFNLTFPDYSHQQAYHYFSAEIYTSLNYLLDFYQLPEMKSSVPLSWETCAIHYIAGIYAESEEHSTAITYLNQLERENSPRQLAISPLSSEDGSFAAHIILKIIRDDKQLGFGYCDDNQLATDETVKIKEALAVIYRYVPDARQEINQFIHQIYLTQETKDGSRFMRSGTNFYMWGMLFTYIHPSHSVAYLTSVSYLMRWVPGY